VYLLLALVGVAVLCLFWQISPLPGSIDWRARRVTVRHKAYLGKAVTAELVAVARRAVQFERWERFPAGEAIVIESIESDERLCELLEKLVVEVTEEDREMNQRGRDSNHFELHDSGLSAVLEALEARRGAPPEGRPSAR
jgi:hypothetical protein